MAVPIQVANSHDLQDDGWTGRHALSLERAIDQEAEMHTRPVRHYTNGPKAEPAALADLQGAAGNAAVASMVGRILSASPGRRLDSAQQSPMTSTMGHQFDDVEIHTDGPAAESARWIDAQAYTIGTHVVFAPGAYSPTTPQGRQLLAHELAHVVQQRRGGAPVEADPSSSVEADANSASRAITGGGPLTVGVGSAVGLARQTPPAVPALTARELFERLVLGMRGFRFSPGGAPEWDPDMIGQPIGPGYATQAGAQVVDAAGNQVVSSFGAYGGGVHAEVAALNNLAGQNISTQGGRLMVVVDQLPCPACAVQLRQFAAARGLRLEVSVPGRPQMSNPTALASPKTTTRSAVQAGRPDYEMRQVIDEPAPAAPVSGVASAGAGQSGKAAEPAMSQAAEPIQAAEPAPQAGAVAAVEEAPIAETALAGTARPLISPKVTTGVGIGVAGLGVAAAIAHPFAVKAIRKEKGYAPVGPLAYAHENILSRIGRILTGAVMEMQEDLRARFDLPVWRANVRKQAAGVPVGGTLLIIYQAPIREEFFQDVQDFAVTYRKKDDGSWEIMPTGTKVPDYDVETVLKGLAIPMIRGDKAIWVPPDLNLIVGEASDRDVGLMLNVLPDRAPEAPGMVYGKDYL